MNPTLFSRRLAFASAFLLCATVGSATVSSAEAQNTGRTVLATNEAVQPGMYLVVTTTDDHDDGVCGPRDCSLREAINLANTPDGGKVISFAPTRFGSQKTIILLKSDLPTITTELTLNGPITLGAGLTIENPNPTSGTALHIDSTGPYITDLTFKGVVALSTTLNKPVPLPRNLTNFDNCAFIARSVGIVSDDSVVMRNCTITGGQTAGILNSAGVYLNQCTVAGNRQGLVLTGSGGAQLGNTLIVGNETNLVYPDNPPYEEGTNRLTGTAAAAGLEVDSQGNVVLADNGGPSLTIALLANSPARDRGINLPGSSIDQRGFRRDANPDLGAFEFLQLPPSVVSVTPQNASDKVGNKRTFSITVSDDKVSDIKEVWFMINDRLGWNSGATFIYRPSTTDPTRGTLTLRRGDAFLTLVQVGTGRTSSSVFDNGAVQLVTSEVSITTSRNTLTLNLPLTIRDGLVGTNTLFAFVSDANGLTDPASLAGDGGFVRFGSYTVAPRFRSGANIAPTLSRLQPNATSTTLRPTGTSAITQTMLFSASDADGMGDIDSLIFVAGKSLKFANGAVFVFYPRDRRLYLRSDDGSSWLGGIQVGQLGTTGILENSQVRVDTSQVKVAIGGDGKTVALSLPMQAKSGLIGANKIWLRAQDKAGLTAPNGDAQGYVQSGTWNVLGSPTPRSAPTFSGVDS